MHIAFTKTFISLSVRSSTRVIFFLLKYAAGFFHVDTNFSSDIKYDWCFIPDSDGTLLKKHISNDINSLNLSCHLFYSLIFFMKISIKLHTSPKETFLKFRKSRSRVQHFRVQSPGPGSQRFQSALGNTSKKSNICIHVDSVREVASRRWQGTLSFSILLPHNFCYNW